MIKRNFCTLFDKNYIFRGLAMHQSLLETGVDFKLWILCMDDVVFDQLGKMKLPNVELIKLADFENGDTKLAAIKPTRSIVEYCWTISSSLPLYIFKHYPDLDNLAYLDSDLYFYSSPEPIYTEMGDNSISIVRHNYSKELTYLEKKSGIYNVSMVIFKNDERALTCLKWWRERCLEWCFAVNEPGRFGDQMYLNDWTTRFAGVHVVKHKGVNLAPWNLNKYLISENNGKIMVDEDPLIYYHYHSFKMYSPNLFQLYYSSYLISKHDEKIIYSTYVSRIKELAAKMKSDYPDFTSGFDKYPGRLVRIKQTLKKLFSFWFFYQSLKK